MCLLLDPVELSKTGDMDTEGRTPLSGDRVQPSFSLFESKKSKVGRRRMASNALRQARDGKRGSQFLQGIFFGFCTHLWCHSVGKKLLDAPNMMSQTSSHGGSTGKAEMRAFRELMMGQTEIVGASNQIHSPFKSREVPIGMAALAS